METIAKEVRKSMINSNNLKKDLIKVTDEKIKRIRQTMHQAWKDNDKKALSKAHSELGEECFQRFRIEQSMR